MRHAPYALHGDLDLSSSSPFYDPSLEGRNEIVDSGREETRSVASMNYGKRFTFSHSYILFVVVNVSPPPLSHSLLGFLFANA